MHICKNFISKDIYLPNIRMNQLKAFRNIKINHKWQQKIFQSVLKTVN